MNVFLTVFNTMSAELSELLYCFWKVVVFSFYQAKHDFIKLPYLFQSFVVSSINKWTKLSHVYLWLFLACISLNISLIYKNCAIISFLFILDIHSLIVLLLLLIPALNSNKTDGQMEFLLNVLDILWTLFLFFWFHSSILIKSVSRHFSQQVTRPWTYNENCFKSDSL